MKWIILGKKIFGVEKDGINFSPLFLHQTLFINEMKESGNCLVGLVAVIMMSIAF